ncbi:hypothetical protein ACP70R_049936 [Stipagrostis hirtigluma subsp. patula]
MRRRETSPAAPLIAVVTILLLLASSSCALSPAAPRASRPPGPAWAPQGREERLRSHARIEAVAARRLGQRPPVRQPPSPKPNGPTTMVTPVPPPPSYR